MRTKSRAPDGALLHEHTTNTSKTTYLILTGIWYIYIKPLVADQVLYSYRMHTDYPYAYVRIDRVIDRNAVAVLYGRTHCD